MDAIEVSGLTKRYGRVEALGGVLKAGNTSEGGFVLRVELPMEAL